MAENNIVVKKIATREAYGAALAEFGGYERIVVLDADLSKSTKTDSFKKKYPERFFNMGIAEANMMSVAAGLASCGKIVFASSFAVFAALRACEQIRNSICYPRLNVKIGSYIWVLGIIALLVYSLVSILLLKRQLKGAQLIDKNIFEAKNLKTPFVLGLINPRIYLPAGLSVEERRHILLHEQIHIHRKDHIIKTLAFLMVSAHWLNPLVWIAFMLVSTDMELSCDERVLKLMNADDASDESADIKKPYANSLLSLATGRHILNGSPLAFGEGNVKGRIKNFLNYKEPRFWMVFFSIIIVIIIGIGLAANPMSNPKSNVSDDNQINNDAQTNNNVQINNDGQINDSAQINNDDQIDGFAWESINKDIAGKGIAEFVEEQLAIITSSPKEALDPHAYIQAHREEYEKIIKYGGEEALQYMLYQFESGNAEGLRGHIMMRLCKELLGVRNNVTDETLTPQEWYDALSTRQEIKLPDFEYDGDDPIEKLVYATEIEKNSRPLDGFTVVASKIFGSYEEDGMLRVFVTTFSATYKLYSNVLDMVGGSIVPSAITYKKDDSGNYVLEKYEQAQYGAHFLPSIREFCTMPVSGKEIPGLADEIIKHYGNRDDIRNLRWENLFKHLKANGIKDAILFNSRGEIEFSMSSPQYTDKIAD
jgi:bla regulator protein BlaR1